MPEKPAKQTGAPEGAPVSLRLPQPDPIADLRRQLAEGRRKMAAATLKRIADGTEGEAKDALLEVAAHLEELGDSHARRGRPAVTFDSDPVRAVRRFIAGSKKELEDGVVRLAFTARRVVDGGAVSPEDLAELCWELKLRATDSTSESVMGQMEALMAAVADDVQGSLDIVRPLADGYLRERGFDRFPRQGFKQHVRNRLAEPRKPGR